MYKIDYQITTKSPVIISDSSSDLNLVNTADYISGNTIRGSLANIYIKNNRLSDAHQDEKFYSWFLGGIVQFSDAVKMSKDEYNQLKTNRELPLSMQYDKLNNSDVYDLLRNEVDDNITTVSFNGIGRISEEGKITTDFIEKSINFHHERDREKGSSVDGIIFNYESINKGQVFSGELQGTKEDLQELISEIGVKNELRIGRSKSTQYGSVVFEFMEESLREVDNNKNILTENIFYLSLLSDAIIYNDFGYSEVSKSNLENYLNKLEGIDEVKIIDSFIKSGMKEHYLSVWKLKTPSEKCFLRGSSFKVSIKGDIEKISNNLNKGLGKYTNTGLGKVSVSLNNFEPYVSKTNVNDYPNERPKVELSENAKNLITDSLKNRIIEEVKVKAMRDFITELRNKDLIKNSLIGRLETFVVSLENIGELEVKLKNLRKPAKQTLESVHFGNRTLLDFMKSNEIKEYIKAIEGTNDLFRKLLNDAQIKPVLTQELELILFKEYWLTFLNLFRKSLKVKGGSNE